LFQFQGIGLTPLRGETSQDDEEAAVMLRPVGDKIGGAPDQIAKAYQKLDEQGSGIRFGMRLDLFTISPATP
jgi:hypothetical protein